MAAQADPARPKLVRPCIAMMFALAAGSSLPSMARAQDPTPAQVDEGRTIYDEFCATCHGRDMAAPGVVAFDLRKFPKDDAARFQNSVLNGKAPAMPAWRDKISNEEVSLLWAYVRGGP